MALTKILNDENKSFQPVLTDKLVYDTKPTVNSFNGITSDAVARAIAGASGDVPAVTEADNGKVLTAIYDEGGAAVEWADAPGGIPDMAGKNGKILGAVNNGGTMEAQWIDKPEVTAGEGISVNNGAVSVKAGTGLAIADLSSNIALKCTAKDYGSVFLHDYQLPHMGVLTAEAVAYFKNNSAAVVTTNYSYTCQTAPGGGVTYGFAICQLNSRGEPTETSLVAYREATTYQTVDANTVLTLDFTHWAPSEQRLTWATIEASPTHYCLSFGYYEVSGSGSVSFTPDAGSQVGLPITYDASTYTKVETDMLVVDDQTEYTMVYNTTPAGGSLDGTPWQAVQAGKRIGVVVPYSAFSGSLAAGSLYTSGKIYMPLASVVDRGSGEYKWNFYLYDGANKWSLVLTCEEDEWSWGTPSVVPG